VADDRSLDRIYLGGLAGAGALAAAAVGLRARLGRAADLIAAIALAGLGVGVWSRWVEPRWLAVTRVRLPWRGPHLRLAFLSDLHVGWEPARLLARAVARVNGSRPDVILLGGDYIEGHDADPAKLAALAPLGGLRAPLGVLAVLGNHDTEPAGASTPRAGAIAARLRALGVTVLGNEARELGGRAVLVALGDHLAGASDATTAFAGCDPARPTIVLAHNWRSLEDPGAGRFDVALTGHTHGGQVRVPFTRIAPPLPDELRPFRAGSYVWPAGGTLFVSRGLGESGVRARLADRPEVLLVDLIPQR
jgi:uncharacterized protein